VLEIQVHVSKPDIPNALGLSISNFGGNNIRLVSTGTHTQKSSATHRLDLRQCHYRHYRYSSLDNLCTVVRVITGGKHTSQLNCDGEPGIAKDIEI
jgi:hypothetical protein